MSKANNNLEALAGYAKDRMNKKNKNSLNVFVGETGGGKTYSTASYLGAIDPTFFDNIDRVVFSPLEFIEAIEKCKQGQCIMYEEAGYSLSAREFMKAQNKMIGIVNQTFRHRNLCVAYTVPSMKFIDLQIRDLMHTIFEMKYIDTENKLAFAKVWQVQHNSLKGTTNLGKYEFKTYNGGRHVIDTVGFPIPPKHWIEAYEVKKLAFTTKIMEEFKDSLSGNAPDKKEIKQIQSQSNVLLKIIPEIKNKYTWHELENIAGVSARTMQRWMENQGVEA